MIFRAPSHTTGGRPKSLLLRPEPLVVDRRWFFSETGEFQLGRSGPRQIGRRLLGIEPCLAAARRRVAEHLLDCTSRRLAEGVARTDAVTPDVLRSQATWSEGLLDFCSCRVACGTQPHRRTLFGRSAIAAESTRRQLGPPSAAGGLAGNSFIIFFYAGEVRSYGSWYNRRETRRCVKIRTSCGAEEPATTPPAPFSATGH